MAITDLTGTKWLLNESFTTMPEGYPFKGITGYSVTYSINFVSNSNSYLYIYFEDKDKNQPGIFYYGRLFQHETHVWDLTSWVSQNYRTIEIIDGTDVTNTDLIDWLQSNATQLSAGYSITFEENGGSTVTDLTEQTALPTPLPTTTKANHVFAGWYYDNLFTQKANAGDELTANVTLYAKWYTPTSWCEDIADAIREKEGSSGSIKHVDFADRIRAL